VHQPAVPIGGNDPKLLLHGALLPLTAQRLLRP
jgi:hypothetical protein